MNYGLPRDTEARIYAHQHGLLNDLLGRVVDQNMQFGVAGEFERSVLHGRNQRHKIELAQCPFPKPRGLNRGDFLQGYAVAGDEIRYPSEFRQAPTVIVATTGSGKTTSPTSMTGGSTTL